MQDARELGADQVLHKASFKQQLPEISSALSEEVKRRIRPISEPQNDMNHIAVFLGFTLAFRYV